MEGEEKVSIRSGRTSGWQKRTKSNREAKEWGDVNLGPDWNRWREAAELERFDKICDE
jgi:hypothetical protein